MSHSSATSNAASNKANVSIRIAGAVGTVQHNSGDHQTINVSSTMNVQQVLTLPADVQHALVQIRDRLAVAFHAEPDTYRVLDRKLEAVTVELGKPERKTFAEKAWQAFVKSAEALDGTGKIGEAIFVHGPKVAEAFGKHLGA